MTSGVNWKMSQCQSIVMWKAAALLSAVPDCKYSDFFGAGM